MQRTSNNSGTASFFVANLMVVAANIFYGVNINVLKYLMPKWITPITCTAIRCVFGALAFILLSYLFKKSRKEKVSLNDYIILLMLGAVGLYGYWQLYMIGLNMTSPVDSSIIMSTSPIWVLILASIVFKEKITKRKVLGLMIGFSGCLLVVLKQSKGSTTNGITGDSLCMLSALIQSFNIVYSKKMLEKYHPITTLKITYISAAVLSLITMAFFKFDAPVLTSHTELTPLLLFAFVLIFPTVIAQLFGELGERKIPVTLYSMYKYIVLVLASVIAIFWGQDAFSWHQPVAGVMILLSVYIVNYHPKTVLLVSKESHL